MQSGATPATIAAAARALPPALRSAAVTASANQLKACSIWHVPSSPAVNRTYFRSALPTLLLPGAYDPTNSPSQEMALTRYLTHSYAVLFPTLTHDLVGVRGTGPCPDSVVRAFLANPQVKPNASCVAKMRMVWE
jgi:hypothetical protein